MAARVLGNDARSITGIASTSSPAGGWAGICSTATVPTDEVETTRVNDTRSLTFPYPRPCFNVHFARSFQPRGAYKVNIYDLTRAAKNSRQPTVSSGGYRPNVQ